MNVELMLLTVLQGLRTQILDAGMLFFTHLGDAGFIWAALTAVLLVFRRTRRVGCVLAAALLVDAVLCNLILKPLVARIRPCDILADVQLLISRPDDFSFPSGHTAASFASVTALWLAGKKQWALASSRCRASLHKSLFAKFFCQNISTSFAPIHPQPTPTSTPPMMSVG